MSTKINPCEVLTYLNQLGYTNIDASQLQAFIKDLKKLIRYDRPENNPQIVKVNIFRELSKEFGRSSILNKNDCEFNSDIDKPDLLNNFHTTELLNSLDDLNLIKSANVSRCPSKALDVGPISTSTTTNTTTTSTSKEQFETCSGTTNSRSNSILACPVHVYKRTCPKSAKSKFPSTVSKCLNDNYPAKSCLQDERKKGKKSVRSSTGTNNNDKIDSYVSQYCPSSKKTIESTTSRNYTHDFTHPCCCSDSLKPRSAVIKCNIGSKQPFPKCDPVNLYKYYERQWRINRIPGENVPRDQRFRWCFREKISCGPPVRLKKPLRKKYDVIMPSY